MDDPDQELANLAAGLPSCDIQGAASVDESSTDFPEPVLKNGRFSHPWECPSLPPPIMKVLKWRRTATKPQALTQEELDRELPVVPTDHTLLSTPPSEGIRVTWIGHATVLVQMENLNILTDPVFSDRCSPIKGIGPKRYRSVPCTVSELPDIHAVIISHNHYDHLDYPTIMALNTRFGGKLSWFVPLRMKGWMVKCGCETVEELTWWKSACIKDNPVEFVFTPAQHWSKRGLWDDNKVLWGSWCIIGQKHRFFFTGDTGYCPVFKQIGQKFGPFDYSAIPIGCYAPRWFMYPQHVDTTDAVKIHQDLRSRRSLAIHWGTFSLADELYMEPRSKLQESLKEAKLTPEDFFTLNIGESHPRESRPGQFHDKMASACAGDAGTVNTPESSVDDKSSKI